MSFSGLSEPCAVGSIVEVVVRLPPSLLRLLWSHKKLVQLNAERSSKQGAVGVEARAPSGRVARCPVSQRANTYTANFTPNEVGEWSISILYDGEHIRGSPFACFVYDPNLVQVYGMDVGVVGQEIKFNVNTTHAGDGTVKVPSSLLFPSATPPGCSLEVKALHNGHAIPCQIENQGGGLYKVQFTPDGAGQYKIHVYFNNMEVKGAPSSPVSNRSGPAANAIMGLSYVCGWANFAGLPIYGHPSYFIKCIASSKPRSMFPFAAMAGSRYPGSPLAPLPHVECEGVDKAAGSPFILDIVDASSVSVYGESLRLGSVDKLATFMIHAVGADSKDLSVFITGSPRSPSGLCNCVKR